MVASIRSIYTKDIYINNTCVIGTWSKYANIINHYTKSIYAKDTFI